MPTPAPPAVRLADLLGALSLATDLANGQPSEHGLRATILAMRLAAQEAAAVRHAVFWTGVLRYLGCVGFALEEARYAAGDDNGLRRSFAHTDMGSASAFLGTVVREVGREAAWHRRIGGVVRLLSDPAAPRRHADAQCETARHFGRTLGMHEDVLLALGQTDERHDGKGFPAGLRGDALSPAIRYVEVARVAVIFLCLEGLDAACRQVRQRAGGQLDPALARRFLAGPAALCEGLDQPSVWDTYLASEPGHRLLAHAPADAVFDAFALMADMKSGYLLGHSHQVAALAQSAARLHGCNEDQARQVYQAGLLHDLGRIAVPTGIWDKPGPLNAAEHERMQLHSYYTDRILRRSPHLAALADIAGRCHERVDGSGYHRGETAGTPLARILAAADCYQACRQDRAHRPAMAEAHAAAALRERVAQGHLCARAVDAVLDAAGVPTKRPRPAPADEILSAREREVMDLLARGLSNKQIAQRLRISPRTVQHHTIHIYAKTGLRSRAGVALWAMERGLLGQPG